QRESMRLAVGSPDSVQTCWLTPFVPFVPPRLTDFQAGNRARPNRCLPMPNVPGLRSCYDKVGRLIYFGRMLDKIRLHAAGQLPLAYHDYLGDAQFFTLDGRCCRFLGVPYSEIKRRALASEDEAVLAWAHAHGTPRTDEEC